MIVQDGQTKIELEGREAWAVRELVAALAEMRGRVGQIVIHLGEVEVQVSSQAWRPKVRLRESIDSLPPSG